MDNTSHQDRCDLTATGILPQCGMLAVPYVPVQRNTQGSYQAEKALVRGTLFPGLDLPYRGLMNDPQGTPTPLQELMALGFAVQELNLYLDTHQDDQEAKELFQKYLKLYCEGTDEYERRYGPLQLTASDGSDWTKGPWPWDGGQTSEQMPEEEV